jgi:hypothetical protein
LGIDEVHAPAVGLDVGGRGLVGIVAVVEGFGVIHAHHPAGGVNPKGTSLKTSAVQYVVRPLSAIGEKGLSVDVQGGPDEEE